MKIDIHSVPDGKILFSHTEPHNSMEKTIAMARHANVSLAGADLHSQDLRGINFSRMDLTGSCLAHTNLDISHCDGAKFDRADFEKAMAGGASFRGASFVNANLCDAQLLSCDLADAKIRNSDCHRVSFHGSDLSGASLDGSVLTDAVVTGTILLGTYLGNIDLRACDLTPIRDDLFGLLAAAPSAVPALCAFLQEGHLRAYQMVEGDQYGMLSKYLMGNPVSDTARYFRKDTHRPAELFAVAIVDGDIPAENQVSAILVEWIEEWLHRTGIASKSKGFDASRYTGRVQ